MKQPTAKRGALAIENPAGRTHTDNRRFERAIANRIWAHYFGRGLVEPIDDMRDTNPASNEPLMDALAEHMRPSFAEVEEAVEGLPPV